MHSIGSHNAQHRLATVRTLDRTLRCFDGRVRWGVLLVSGSLVAEIYVEQTAAALEVGLALGIAVAAISADLYKILGQDV